MLETLALSVLSLSLLSTTAHALSIQVPRTLDSGPAPFPDVLGPVSQLHLVNTIISPDGWNRSAVLANGMFPGPLIQANKGDDFAIQLINSLTDTTMDVDSSVHWHGIFQHKSNWADGVAFVTQCPLRPDEAFTHKFNARNQTGTYWYHSHFRTQYCDGLSGPLVIYDPDDPLGFMYDVDDADTVITLSDWYHQTSSEIVSIVAARKIAPASNATLINGLGRYNGGPSSPLAVVNVQQGLRYRFRILSMSCAPWFNFTIDGHRMTIIEVDGNEVEPVEVDWIPVFAAQRYSVVVTANQTVDNYWIRALSSEAPAGFQNAQNMAILRYAGAPAQDPTSPPGPYEIPFDEGRLHPLVNPAAPGIPEIGQADKTLALAPDFNLTAFRFSFNNTPFNNPPVPVLLQILSGARHPSQMLPNDTIFELPSNSVIEISFPNPTAVGGPHPIHLHGHAFSVVRVAGSNVTNFVNPVRRDSVSTGGPNDNVVIRFVTDNPGPWFLHCHIDWHLNFGLAAVMAESPAQAAEEEVAVIPPDWGQLCLPDQAWGQTVLSTLGQLS